MQLFHHPYSLDSQKVRLLLEEKNIDYTSHHVNPITGKNMDPFFFRMNPSGKLPVFQNGSHIIYDTIEIIRYIERISVVSSGMDGLTPSSSEEVVQWMHRIQEWDPKYFTLFHIPVRHRTSIFKFLRRVIIARMAESPDLASVYHLTLREAYETDEKLRNPEVLRRCEEQLIRLLDQVDSRLGESSSSSYLVGEQFTLADAMLIPVLARISLLNLETMYISIRPNVAKYWSGVHHRPSYKKVIGRYFDGWQKQITLCKTWCFLHIRSMLRKY
ncbi:transferase [Lithospermum erythrorhizon]|uniref:Transferase n=1 Tax=Lithospermum erythrorhizon TaxID=34254 RepID=A0AAV3QDN8_LITER